MSRLPRLEGEQKSGIIWYDNLRQSPKAIWKLPKLMVRRSVSITTPAIQYLISGTPLYFQENHDD
jgi:hypothetical protein